MLLLAALEGLCSKNGFCGMVISAREKAMENPCMSAAIAFTLGRISEVFSKHVLSGLR